MEIEDVSGDFKVACIGCDDLWAIEDAKLAITEGGGVTARCPTCVEEGVNADGT